MRFFGSPRLSVKNELKYSGIVKLKHLAFVARDSTLQKQKHFENINANRTNFANLRAISNVIRPSVTVKRLTESGATYS